MNENRSRKMPLSKSHARPWKDVSLDMTYVDALRRVLPGLDWRQDDPPRTPYWARGKGPPDRLDIDDEVWKLRQVRDSGNRQACALRSDDELRRSFIEDPILLAREFVARGVEAGRLANERNRLAEQYEERLRIDLDRQQRRLDKFARLEQSSSHGVDKQSESRPLSPGEVRGDWPLSDRVKAEEEVTYLLSAARSRCEMLLEATVAEIESLRTPTDASWIQAFIQQMGEAWHLLTGRMPSSTSGPFTNFTIAGISAVAEHPRDAQIEHQIRKVVESAGETETKRFDRWIRPARGFDRRLSLITKKLIHIDEDVARVLLSEKLPPWSGEIKQRDTAIINTVRDLSVILARLDQPDEEMAAVRLTIKNLCAVSSPELKSYLQGKLEAAGVDLGP